MIETFARTEVPKPGALVEGLRDRPEGATYRYDRSGHEILRVARGIDEALADAVARGPVDLALVVLDPGIVVCSRVEGALPWAGAAFHWHRVDRAERILPAIGSTSALDSTVDLILLEARGGRVRAARPLHLPPEFARALHQAILDQSRFPYDPSEERRALESLARRCPNPGIAPGLRLGQGPPGRLSHAADRLDGRLTFRHNPGGKGGAIAGVSAAARPDPEEVDRPCGLIGFTRRTGPTRSGSTTCPSRWPAPAGSSSGSARRP